MDRYFLHDVFDAALDYLSERGRPSESTASDVEAAVKAAAKKIIDARTAAMEKAVKAQAKALGQVVTEAVAGKMPRVNFDFDRITRHASKVAADDTRWKK